MNDGIKASICVACAFITAILLTVLFSFVFGGGDGAVIAGMVFGVISAVVWVFALDHWIS